MGALNPAVALDVHESVATVRLTNVEGGNVFDRRLAQGVRIAAERIRDDQSVRAVLIVADGATFSRGGDVAQFREAGSSQYSDLFAELIDEFSPALSTFHALDAPIVTAVNGWAVGAGLSLVGLADIVLADPGARFATAFTGVGLPGDAGVTWFLTHAVGVRRALSLMLRGTAFTAAEALDWGLVTEITPAGSLLEQAEGVARELAAGPTRAFGHVRRNLRAAVSNDLERQVRLERSATIDCGQTRDLDHALAAFAERRTPTFIGS